MGSLLFKKR